MSLRLIDALSPNFNERRHPLDMLVMHYTGMQSGEAAMQRMHEPEAEASAHYMVEEDGRIFQLVTEDKRAWHAGRALWEGDDDINSRSIGIEIVNPGHEWGYRPFPDVQIDAVIALSHGILARWPIPQRRIVAHSDIAPLRKEDPGELFPWRQLAAAGIGLWPTIDQVADVSIEASTARLEDVQGHLVDIGYTLEVSGLTDPPTQAVIRAFQRRWRQDRIDGVADGETRALIAAVAMLVRKDRSGR